MKKEQNSAKMENNVLSERHTYVNEIKSKWNYDVDFEIQNLPYTPFTIGRKGDEFCIMLGNNRISEITKQQEFLIEDWKDPTWDNIMRLIGGMIEITDKLKKTGEL